MPDHVGCTPLCGIYTPILAQWPDICLLSNPPYILIINMVLCDSKLLSSKISIILQVYQSVMNTYTHSPKCMLIELM